MILVNFSQRFKRFQTPQLELLMHQKVERWVDVNLILEADQPLAEQVADQLLRLPCTSTELRSQLVVVNLPDSETQAAAVLAYLRGVMGYAPRVLRTRLRMMGWTSTAEIIEILDLQSLEDLGEKSFIDSDK